MMAFELAGCFFESGLKKFLENLQSPSATDANDAYAARSRRGSYCSNGFFRAAAGGWDWLEKIQGISFL